MSIDKLTEIEIKFSRLQKSGACLIVSVLLIDIGFLMLSEHFRRFVLDVRNRDRLNDEYAQLFAKGIDDLTNATKGTFSAMEERLKKQELEIERLKQILERRELR